jgi:hypothetical protein
MLPEVKPFKVNDENDLRYFIALDLEEFVDVVESLLANFKELVHVASSFASLSST